MCQCILRSPPLGFTKDFYDPPTCHFSTTIHSEGLNVEVRTMQTLEMDKVS